MTRRWLGALCISLLPLAARAETQNPPPVGSALLLQRGFSIGVLDPLRIAVRSDLELSVHPILFLPVSPNAGLRVAWVRRRHFVLTGEYGLSMSTGLLRVSKGFLFPSWKTSDNDIGWVLVPDVGVAATWTFCNTLAPNALTARIDTAIGVPLGRNDATPLDTYAPLELALAPVTSGLRSHAGLQYDWALWHAVHARFGADVFYVGAVTDQAPPKSPFTLDARLALDIYPSQAVRLSFGVIAYDYDQRRSEVQRGADGRALRVDVRSRELWPTFDLVVYR